MNINKWFKYNTSEIVGKTIAISGTTGGLGVELCKHLASLGANLIFLNRNVEKSEELKNNIIKSYPNCKIDIIKVDFVNINSVKNAVITLKDMSFDMLVFNAGAYKIQRYKTECGYDNIFQINFVSPYFMIRELLPKLKSIKNSRVVIVGSIAHNYSKLNIEDVDFSLNKKCSRVYGNAKRLLMFSLYELFKNEKDVSLSVCHPGITYTNITSHYPKLINIIIKYPMKIVFMHPKKASLSVVKSIFEETKYHEWIGPKMFNIWGYPKKKTLNTTSSIESYTIGKIADKIYNKIK